MKDKTVIMIKCYVYVFQIIFTVLISLQGFFIFLFNCLRQAHIRHSWMTLLFPKTARASSLPARQDPPKRHVTSNVTSSSAGVMTATSNVSSSEGSESHNPGSQSNNIAEVHENGGFENKEPVQNTLEDLSNIEIDFKVYADSDCAVTVAATADTSDNDHCHPSKQAADDCVHNHTSNA